MSFSHTTTVFPPSADESKLKCMSSTFFVPSDVNVCETVTGFPLTMTASPVSLSMSVPVIVYSLPAMVSVIVTLSTISVSADGLIIWYCVFASDACVVITGVGSEWFSIVPISTVTLSLLIENSPL